MFGIKRRVKRVFEVCAAGIALWLIICMINDPDHSDILELVRIIDDTKHDVTIRK